jgi:hypothetical protein
MAEKMLNARSANKFGLRSTRKCLFKKIEREKNHTFFSGKLTFDENGLGLSASSLIFLPD